jgi:hypothetical protein
MHHKDSEKENRELRKRLKVPFPNTSEKFLSKELSYSSFKPHPPTTHPTFSLLQLQSRRTHDFFNCKRKPSQTKCIPSATLTPFLTESTHSKRYEEYAQ